MSDFVVNASQSISIGVAASVISLASNVPDTSGNQSTMLKRARLAKITNTHATQTIFISKRTTPTTAVFDVAIPAGKSEIIGLPLDLDTLSMIASGATTTGFVHLGDFYG